MANTFTKIASVTVGSGGAASINFTSISSTYTDLCLLISARDNRATAESDFWKLQFNGDTGANYSQKSLGAGAGSGAVSGVDTGATSTNGVGLNGNSGTANTFSNQSIYIPNYAGSNYKSTSADSVSEFNGAYTTTVGMGFNAGLWSNTAAITSISFQPGVGTSFNQYSTATLYGIKNS